MINRIVKMEVIIVLTHPILITNFILIIQQIMVLVGLNGGKIIMAG